MSVLQENIPPLLSGTNLFQFLFEMKELSPNDILVFAAGCSIIATVFVTADLVSYLVNLSGERKSLLGLVYYSFWGSVLNFILWGIGAGLVGYLASIMQFSKLTIQASVIIGASWPYVLNRLINSTYADEDEQN